MVYTRHIRKILIRSTTQKFLTDSAYYHAHKMAAEESESSSSWQQIESPPFKREVSDLRFVNISIKCYEKKTGSGFKEEYYAYKIIAMWVLCSCSVL